MPSKNPASRPPPVQEYNRRNPALLHPRPPRLTRYQPDNLTALQRPNRNRSRSSPQFNVHNFQTPYAFGPANYNPTTPSLLNNRNYPHNPNNPNLHLNITQSDPIPPRRSSIVEFNDPTSPFLESTYGNILTPEIYIPHYEHNLKETNPIPQPSPRQRRPSVILSSSAGSIGRPISLWQTNRSITGADIASDSERYNSNHRMEQSGYFSSKKKGRAQSANRSSYGTIPRAMPPSGQGDHLDAVEATVIVQGVESARSRQNGHGGNGNEGDRLLGNVPKWNNGAEEEILTTWQTETKELTKNSIPLVITLALQYSLTLASVFSAGNLGSNELAAVSLAGMTANITGYAIYQGLATALDTLCAQAYGSGNKHLVGLHTQRMAVFLMFLTIPIAIVWMYSEEILKMIIPEDELSRLAGLYLRILILGAPGYALFECGKRYTQAQGLFMASTIVLLICAPLNAFLNYTLVWHPTIGIGFAGAPVAVVIVDYLMPLLLFLYVRFVAGRECWGGFSKRAFTNWWPMITLALPGLVMVEAEYLAFEVLTLMASYFSTSHVAAQAIVAQAGSVMYQIPFALSIATSTRVGTFVGGMSPTAAATTAHTALTLSTILGTLNGGLLLSTRFLIPQCFTDDAHVIAIAAAAMPIVGFFQIFDSIAAVAAGVLRGQGRQYVGSYVNLVTYYVAALPWSWYSGFILGWEVKGLWSGMALALAIIAVVEVLVVICTNWSRVVGEARARESWA